MEFQRGPKEFVIARRCPDMVVGDNIKTLMLGHRKYLLYWTKTSKN